MVVSLSDWATVRVPRGWQVTPFMGEPAPVYFPLDFISTARLPAACPGGGSSSCAGQNLCFAPHWTTPDGGVILEWAHAEIPSEQTLANLPGYQTTIDHHPAKVQSGRATDACPPGAGTELDAHIAATTNDLGGERFDMTACFGRLAGGNEHAAVLTMLDSLHLRYS